VSTRSRGELTQLDNEASRLIKELNNQFVYLADLTQHAPRELRQQFQHHVDSERNRMLSELPIERLKDFGEKVRIDPLKRAGIDMGTALTMGTIGFELIPGLGTVSAAAIRLAIEAARKSFSDEPVHMPRPDQLRRDQTGLLQAAAREMRARNVPAGLVPQLESALSALEQELETLRNQRSRIRRFFGRGGTQDQVQQTAHDLHAEVHSSQVADLIRRAHEATQASTVPNSFDDLLNEYSNQFADYSSILEEVVNELGGAGDAVVEKARGGLPASVAARIEALELHTVGLHVHLRGYQEFGVQFMVEQARVILGDEMGLGKTIQALGVMTHLAYAEQANRFVVVAPASILANWEREIERRTDFNVHLLHGPQREALMARWLKSGGIALTSYATLRSLPNLEHIAVDLLVADEAHYAKNPGSKRTQAVGRLAQHAKRVVLMSGTPLENNIDEFKNLLDLTNPGFLRSIAVGLQDNSRFGFRQAVAPVYLRRNQEDVLTELPELIELEEWVDLNAGERAAHTQAVTDRNMMGMRQAAIFGGGETSAKLERVADLLREYDKSGQRVVVFSYFLGALDAIQQMVPNTFRIDGSVSPAARMDIVDRFGLFDGPAVLVSQITAGGVGLNLQAASVVILMEPQFKPTTEWQAIARAHRMGQTRRVTVHRMLARRCVDESLYELVAVKAKIFDDYARESMLKDASAASTDQGNDGIMNRIFELEAERLQMSTPATDS